MLLRILPTCACIQPKSRKWPWSSPAGMMRMAGPVGVVLAGECTGTYVNVPSFISMIEPLSVFPSVVASSLNQSGFEPAAAVPR